LRDEYITEFTSDFNSLDVYMAVIFSHLNQ
jgi:hypothetical protein